MITGAVNSDREAVVRITWRDVSGQKHERDAIIDTGFSGWLTLPPDFIAGLGLPWRDVGAAVLADGSQVLFDSYDAVVIWDGDALAVGQGDYDGITRDRCGDRGGVDDGSTFSH